MKGPIDLFKKPFKAFLDRIADRTAHRIVQYMSSQSGAASPAHHPEDNQKIIDYLESHRTRKLHVGSHEKLLEGWLNTDLYPPRSEVVFLDATQPFPFDDCIFDYVYHEHMMEHLEYGQGLSFLRECCRTLKDGGMIRIATPDLQMLIDLYAPTKTALQKEYIRFSVDSYMPKIGVYEDVFVINNFVRDWGHKFIYDFKALKGALQHTGFIDIIKCEPGKSGHEDLRQLEYQTFDRLFETFVVEATKPERVKS
jgi:predicted SAM-dependent methyltransferase